MKKRINRRRFKKIVRSRSPWASLRKTINQFNHLNRTRSSKPESLYRDKAEMMRLKSSIDKLKKELKEAQKSNLDLECANESLKLKLSLTESQLADILYSLHVVHESIKDKEDNVDA